jgi:hypothetical protein
MPRPKHLIHHLVLRRLTGLQKVDGRVLLCTPLQVPVPTQLFQGSLLLGTLTRAVLGDRAMSGAEVGGGGGGRTHMRAAASMVTGTQTPALPCNI